MSAEQHEDRLFDDAARPTSTHDFRLSAEVDSVNYYRRMVCTRCGGRMNEAAPICPARKPDKL